ncbi:MAG: MoaD/ThiS family protein [Gammaproteobacteria bacterium]|jgi:molybdopterin converting factor small subunit|nr:MoaD/ThiS family protein [Gammaproteobacteria bacterium]
MGITFKLYAGLSQYLPQSARRNAATMELQPEETVDQFIERQKVPRAEVHLVLVNGRHLESAERERHVLKEGDTLAIWPPVAGG